ncbi:hypothetical protein DSECCO2_649010 [anaerobic digester metagenome]
MAPHAPAGSPSSVPSRGPEERGRSFSFYVSVAIFLVIVGAVLYMLASGLMHGSEERDFELAITPSGGSIAAGERMNVEVRISLLRSGPSFFEYDLPVTLHAEEVPEGIYVTFNPATDLPDPQFTSRMLVAHAGAAPGTYSFQVHATGTDGRSLSLPFQLQVTGTAPSTTAAR